MRYISLGIAAAILILGPLPALFVKERYYESGLTNTQNKVGLLFSLRETLSCKSFLILCMFTVLFLLGTSIFDSYGRYVGTYYVLGGDWDKGAWFQALGTIIYTVVSLTMIPVFRKWSEFIGKTKCLFISTGLVLFSSCITWWTNTPEQPYLMLISTIFIGAGYAGLWLMLPSMQADVIDEDELKTGERREGSFAAIYSWVLKLSFCIGFMASGPLLKFTGFDADLAGDQPAEVMTNLRLGYIILPVTSLIIAIFILRGYKLNSDKAHEIRAELELRRGKA